MLDVHPSEKSKHYDPRNTEKTINVVHILKGYTKTDFVGPSLYLSTIKTDYKKTEPKLKT